MYQEYDPASERQQELLYQLLHPAQWPQMPSLTNNAARDLIDERLGPGRKDAHLPVEDWQRRFLSSRGSTCSGMTRGEATDPLLIISSNQSLNRLN